MLDHYNLRNSSLETSQLGRTLDLLEIKCSKLIPSSMCKTFYFSKIRSLNWVHGIKIMVYLYVYRVCKVLGTLDQRLPGSKPSLDLSHDSVGRVYFQDERSGVLRCGYVERKKPGSHSLISLPIQWTPFALRINQYLTKIVSVFTINYQCTASNSLHIQWAFLLCT